MNAHPKPGDCSPGLMRCEYLGGIDNNYVEFRVSDYTKSSSEGSGNYCLGFLGDESGGL